MLLLPATFLVLAAIFLVLSTQACSFSDHCYYCLLPFWSWLLSFLSCLLKSVPFLIIAVTACYLSGSFCHVLTIPYLFCHKQHVSYILSLPVCCYLSCPCLSPPVRQLPSVSCPLLFSALLSFPCMTASARYLSKTVCSLSLPVSSCSLPPPVTLPRCYFLLWGCTFPVPAASGNYLSCLVFSLQLPN